MGVMLWNSYVKEYSEQKGTTLIGTIQLEDKNDEG